MVYHNPAPETLEMHLTYLMDRFNIISLNQLVVAIEEHDWQRIPPKSLVITLDDGYLENYALLDILSKYEIPVTFYVCAGIVDTQRHYWFLDFAAHAEKLKSLPNEFRLEQLASSGDFVLTKSFVERQALSKTEMLVMQRHNIDFQSHALFHPVLTTCTDEVCWIEISESKRVLEDMLREPVMHFAYPNGDYGEREKDFVREAGYRSARSLDTGWNGPSADLYALKSMNVSDDATLNEMVVQLHGIFPYFRYFMQGSFAGKHSTIQLHRDLL